MEADRAVIPGLRFLLRRGRWVARAAGVGAAAVVWTALNGRDAIQLPGMAEPYVLGTVEPAVATVLTYGIVKAMVWRATGRFFALAETWVRDFGRDSQDLR